MTIPERTLHIDFETRSTIDLRKAGIDVYAEHPSTDAWCMGYAFDDKPAEIWKRGDPLPIELAMHVASGGKVFAHNAVFELLIWNQVMGPKHHWPELRPEQTHCTAAMAAAMALPRSLDEVAWALGLSEKKDAEGHKVMLRLCRPRKLLADGTPLWWDDPKKFEVLYAYCKQDIEVERAVERRLRPLSAGEREIWLLDYKINRRGVQVDLPLCRAAKRVMDQQYMVLDDQIEAITQGAVTSANQRDKMVAWLNSHGLAVTSLTKGDVSDLLDTTTLDRRVRQVLENRQLASKTSTAKVDALLTRVNTDGRMRDNHLFCGASTGRWSGRGFQPQNLPRPVYLDDDDGEKAVRKIETAVKSVMTGDLDSVAMAWGNPMQLLSDLVRPMVTAAPGKKLYAIDFSNIEGRLLAYMAGEQWKVDAFRDFDAGVGDDLYKLAYAKSFGVPISAVGKPERTIGKVQELACGYQGGKGAFAKMGANYGLQLPEDRVDEIVQAWRHAHPAVTKFWKDLELSAFQAVANAGTQVPVGPGGKVKMLRQNGWLLIQLPSKRVLYYAAPAIRPVETKFGVKDAVTFMGINSVTRSWERQQAYGGRWAENCVQAAASCLLRHAMKTLEAAGYSIVLTVHDEIVVEVDEGFGSLEHLTALMTSKPSWLSGCPIAAAGWGPEDRYRK